MADEVINLDDGTENNNAPDSNANDPAQAKATGLLTNLNTKFQPFIDEIKNNKIMLFGLIAIGALVVIFLILLIVLILVSSPKKAQDVENISRKIIQPAPILSEQKRPEVDGAELGNMIKKANILYEQGDKLEALHLFENIAVYSQSIAYYNLGVIKLKEGDYQQAIRSFDGAIHVGEDISVSAFNAAYSAYMLGNMNLYEYYLGISSSYLFYVANQPLYSYLYGLLEYYKGFYFESLSPFLNPSSKSYVNESKKMAAEVFLIFGDEYNALAQLKQVANKDDNFAIALLHARLG